MRSVIFLRIASALTLVHAVLHTIGGVFGGVPPAAQPVVMAMKAHQFLAMGAMRTMWDFHMGLGLAVGVFLTVEAVMFWQLGSLAKSDALRLRPVLATFLVGYLGLAVVSYQYFFAGPVITEILISLCLGLAAVSAKQMVDGAVDRRPAA